MRSISPTEFERIPWQADETQETAVAILPAETNPDGIDLVFARPAEWAIPDGGWDRNRLSLHCIGYTMMGQRKITMEIYCYRLREVSQPWSVLEEILLQLVQSMRGLPEPKGFFRFDDPRNPWDK